jgi:hypothetical protein
VAEFFGLKFDFETISPKIIIKTLVNHQTTPNHPKKTQKKQKPTHQKNQNTTRSSFQSMFIEKTHHHQTFLIE